MSTQQEQEAKIKVLETLWTDGIDKRTSSTGISTHALTRCRNAQYRDGSLEKAAGIEIVCDAGKAVDAVFEWNGKKVFSSGQTLYYTDYVTETLIGTLSGTSKPCYLVFGDELLIASGVKLQYVTTAWAITTVAFAPNLDRIWIEGGRVWGTIAGDDFAYGSKVGTFKLSGDFDTTPQPGADWSGVAAVDYLNTALYYEVGYKDNLDIVSAELFFGDVIFFKEKDGKYRQYRKTGQFPNWSIVALSPAIHVYKTSATLNDLFCIGQDGFKSLSTVTDYGDIKWNDVGEKINDDIVRNVTVGAKVWHVPLRKTIYVKVKAENILWCFHYSQKCSDGTYGAWTNRYLTAEPHDIWQFENETYIAYGNKIGKLDNDLTTDDSAEFVMDCASKLLVSDDDFDVLRYKLYLENSVAGAGNVSIGNFSAGLTFEDTDLVAFSDDGDAFTDDGIAFGKEFTSLDERIRSTLSGELSLGLKVNTGKVKFLSMKVWTGVVASG